MKTGSLAPQLRHRGGALPWSLSRVEREYEFVRRLDAPRISLPGERWLATRVADGQAAVVSLIPRDALTHERAEALALDLTRAEQLGPHRQISPLLASDVSDECIAFAAALTEGDDFASLVAQTGSLPPDAATDCLRQALAGLAYAHGRGVTHGRLAPEDFRLDYDGVLKIGNWGCAAAHAACGAESLAQRDLRRLADAVVFLLTGEERDTDSGSGAWDAAALREACSDVTDDLVTVLQRLASAGEGDGFSSAAEALLALDAPMPVTPQHSDVHAAPTPSEEPCAACAAVEVAPRETATTQPCCHSAPVESLAPATAPESEAAPRSPCEPMNRDAAPSPRGSARLYASLCVTAVVLLAAALAGWLWWR